MLIHEKHDDLLCHAISCLTGLQASQTLGQVLLPSAVTAIDWKLMITYMAVGQNVHLTLSELFGINMY